MEPIFDLLLASLIFFKLQAPLESSALLSSYIGSAWIVISFVMIKTASRLHGVVVRPTDLSCENPNLSLGLIVILIHRSEGSFAVVDGGLWLIQQTLEVRDGLPRWFSKSKNATLTVVFFCVSGRKDDFFSLLENNMHSKRTLYRFRK